MKEFSEIYLAWRLGQGKRRHIVGVLKRSPVGEFTFSYDIKAVSEAKKEGFTDYVELPYSDKTYRGEVLEVFAQRIIKPARTDVQTFYDFWEIEPGNVNDKFYMLGHTQGLLPTDNFELLADYTPIEGLHFLTDLADVSKRKLPADFVKIGDILTFKLESFNLYDTSAVAVYKGDTQLGYIKQIHSRIFHKVQGEHLKLTVKAIDQNGTIKKIFAKITIGV